MLSSKGLSRSFGMSDATRNRIRRLCFISEINVTRRVPLNLWYSLVV